MTAAEQLDPPRFRGAPPQCAKTNLPAHESEKALRKFMFDNAPRNHISYIWKCEFCQGWHNHSISPNTKHHP